MQTENWKDMIGFEGLYEISNLGRHRTKERLSIRKDIPTTIIPSKILKTNLHKCGYVKVTISKDCKQYYFLMHRLVALNFIPNPNNYPQINHLDGNKLNNTVSNLEWCTCKENINHAHIMGLSADVNGEKNGMSKLTNIQVNEIRSLLLEKKLLQTEIAKLYNISPTTVCEIKKGRKWQNIK